MPSPSRPVSLPSIHELFPEYLMQLPASSRNHLTVSNSGQRHTSSPHHHRSQAQPSSIFAHPGEQVSRVTTSSPYHYHSNDHHARATPASRSLGAPHVSPRPAGGPSSFPPSQQRPTPHHRDHHQDVHLDHPVLSIPLSYSERTPKGQGYPGAQSNTLPGSIHAPPPPADDPENMSDEETPSPGSQSAIPRKHICPICHKAFNRPSSLKIHYNTHTGATPFRCPWPKCGREFNVNSNMRRHYRNHTTNANQESQDDVARRRRRRSSASSPNTPSSPPVMQQLVRETPSQPHRSPVHYDLNDDAPPPPSSGRTPDPPHHHHQYSQYRVYKYSKDYDGMDLDEVEDYAVSEDLHRSRRLTVPVIRASERLVEPRGSEKPVSRYTGAPSVEQERTLPHAHHAHQHAHHNQHAHHHHHHHHHQLSRSSSSSMRIRALTPGSSFHSSSPSPSPSPSLSAASHSSPFDSPLPSTLTSPVNSPVILPRTSQQPQPQQQQQQQQQQQYQYSPSMPYLRGTTADPHVSTALRPAFNSGSSRSRR